MYKILRLKKLIIQNTHTNKTITATVFLHPNSWQPDKNPRQWQITDLTHSAAPCLTKQLQNLQTDLLHHHPKEIDRKLALKAPESHTIQSSRKKSAKNEASRQKKRRNKTQKCARVKPPDRSKSSVESSVRIAGYRTLLRTKLIHCGSARWSKSRR